MSVDGKASFYRQFAQADERFTAEVEPLFNQIRCPVCILWGEQDPWIPFARGEALARLIKPEAFEVLHGVGHLPQLERPEAVLTAIDHFLPA